MGHYDTGMAVLSPPDLGAEIGLTFPTMYAGQRVYSPDEVPEIPVRDLGARVRAELQVLAGRLTPGGRVAITAGSRGITNIPLVLKACGDALRDLGAQPFV